jgi:hypothetical protein
MAGHQADKDLSQGERMEIFLALVEGQDSGLAVAKSREAIATRFGLSDQQVRRIEREGIEAEWPPLG